MAVILGPVVKNNAYAYPGAAGDVVANKFSMTIPAASSTTDIYEIGSIPPGCTVVDMIADVQASLGAAGCVFDVGIISGSPGAQNNADNVTPRTCGAEFFAALTAVGSAVTRMTAVTGFRVAPVNYERGIGIKFGTRGTGTAGTVVLTTLVVA
jgi:hypothetical protein